MKKLIRCPYCGESYYRQLYATCTAVYWEPVFRDGVLQNSNPNVTTIHCHCCACQSEFIYEDKGDWDDAYPMPL